MVMLTFFAMPQVDRKELREPDSAVGMRRLHDYLPAAWIDDAIRSTDKASIRRRRLPAEKVVFLVIALALYRQHSASEVVDELDIALPKMDGAFVSKSAITQARQRVGPAPVEWLFKESAKNWITESGDQAKFMCRLLKICLSPFLIDGPPMIVSFRKVRPVLRLACLGQFRTVDSSVEIADNCSS
jgi:Insertion element 4 transposase N-terminal